MLNEKQITENYDKLINIIETTFEGTRKDNLLKMYDYFDIRIATAPASAKLHYHYAFPGGYVLHILHVYKIAKKMAKLFELSGGTMDFTDKELAFVALHHDLGKVGDIKHDYYIPQENDWRRKNMNETFSFNPDLQYMSVTDRSLYLLSHFNISISQTEFLGIKLSDGLYDSANEHYLKAYSEAMILKTNLPYIIHWSDHMATRAEYCEYKEQTEAEAGRITNKMNKILGAKKPKIATKKTVAHSEFKKIFDGD